MENINKNTHFNLFDKISDALIEMESKNGYGSYEHEYPLYTTKIELTLKPKTYNFIYEGLKKDVHDVDMGNILYGGFLISIKKYENGKHS